MELGCPVHILSVALDDPLRNIRKRLQLDSSKKPDSPVVIFYVHRLSYGLKILCGRHEMPVVLSAPNVLLPFVNAVNKPREEDLQRGCGRRRRNRFVPR